MDRDQDVFLLFLEDPPSASLERDLEDVVARLGSARAWTVAPPVVVDVRDSIEDGGPDPGASPTIGVSLTVPSAARAAGAPGADRSALGDCEAVLEAVARLSATHGVTFEVELNEEYIGSVSDGRPDAGLVKGLLEPWRAAAGRSPR